MVAFAASGGIGDAAFEAKLAAALRPSPSATSTLATTVLSSDLDGDGTPELLVSVPLPGFAPLLVAGAKTAPRSLLPPGVSEVPLDDLTTIQRIFPLDDTPARSAALVTRLTRGASALNTEVLVVGWDGQRSTVLFDQAISDWAGPARWQLTSDRQIELTCPAFGVYDHKLLPHPTQVRRFRWDPSAGTFALVFRHTEPPASRRGLMNLAEADFYAGDWDHAIQHYQTLVDAPPPTEPDDAVDWVDFARLRLGEIAALRGQTVEAVSWLSGAARAAPPLGPAAAAFLVAARDGDAARGFAAIQSGDLPARFQSGSVGNLGFPVALGAFAALGPGAAAALDRIVAPSRLTADGARAALTGQGFVVGDVVVGDLDGDGSPEVGAVLPLGTRQADFWLFVRVDGRWRAISVGSAPDGLGGLDLLPLGGRAIQVRTPRGASEPFIRLGWNGRIVGTVGPEDQLNQIATNFLPTTGCTFGENAQK